jgi:hypothetical protein
MKLFFNKTLDIKFFCLKYLNKYINYKKKPSAKKINAYVMGDSDLTSLNEAFSKIGC